MRKVTSQRAANLLIGLEPNYAKGHELDRNEFALALNWYSGTKDYKQSLKYIIAWATESNKYTKAQIAWLKETPPFYIPNAIGWMCRIMSNGYRVPEVYYPRNEQWVVRAMREAEHHHNLKIAEKTATGVEKRAIQDIIAEGVARVGNKLCAEFEDQFDKFIDNGFASNWKIADYLKLENARPLHVEILQDHMGLVYAELQLADLRIDKEVFEAYERWGKRNITKMRKWLEKTLQEMKEHYAITRVRKTRGTTKKFTPKDMVDGLVYTKEFEGRTSVLAEKVIGASEVWVWYTNTGEIGCYKGTNLSMNGTVVTNVESQSSVRPGAKILDDAIKSVQTDGQKKLNDFFTGRFNRKTFTDFKPRIYSKVLILRVF